MKRSLAVLVVACVFASAASASAPASTQPSSNRPVVVVRVPQSGFDWTDALIGAGAASGSLLALAGGAQILGRRREFGGAER